MADGQLDLPFDVHVTAESVDTSDLQSNIQRALSNVKLPTEELGKQIERWLSTSTSGVSHGFAQQTEALSQGFKDIGALDTFREMSEGVDEVRRKIEGLHGSIVEMLRGYDELHYDPTGMEGNSGPVVQEPRPVDFAGAQEAIVQMADLISQYNEKIATLDETLTNMESSMRAEMDAAEAATAQTEESATAYEETATAAESAAEAIEEVAEAETGGAPTADVGDGYEEAAEDTTTWRDRIDEVVQRNGEVISQTSSIAAGVSKIGNVAGKAFGKLGSVIKSGIGHAKSFGDQASKSFDRAGNKAKRMTLQMIKAMIGVRGFYMLVRKLKSAITEAFQAMAQQVPEIGQQFNDFKTALNQIKGSIGTAFQPIISAVLPILTQLLGMLNTVIEAVARFNAVLTGQKYIYKYSAAQQEFAKSVGGTGKAAKKATADLMGFDEINRLSAPNDNSGGGGSSKMGDYEKVDVDPSDAISEFAEKLKKAWKDADFTEIGQIIGNKIKDGMEIATSFFDTEGQKWAKHLSKSLTTLINGLVSVPDLGKSIGTAIGSALNVGITFLHDFWRDTNFTGIGEQLAGAINGLFEKIDWTGLGEYFGFKFNGIFNFIDGFATDMNWDNIGTSIGESINSMIETMDVGKATSSVSKLLVGILQSGISLLTTTDFNAIGEELANGLAGIDFVGILGNAGTLISKGAQGILDMVISFIEKTDWDKTSKELINGIAKMFENVWDDGALIQKLAKGVGALFGAAFVAFWNLGGFIYDNVIVPLGEALESEFEQFDTGWIGTDIILGILKGIWDALIGIGQWISENIVQPIIDGICAAFGISSPATTMIEIGLDLIAGLFEGLKGIWEAIKGIFDTLKENILGVFESIGEGIGKIWSGITSAATTAWNGIKSGVVTICQSILRVITGIFNNLKDGVINAFKMVRDVGELVWNGFLNILKKIVNWLIGVINGFIGGCETLVNGFVDAMNLLIEGVKFATDWIPGPDLQYLAKASFPRVPYLAQGAVLPPNSPFLAVVGDQTSGTNVEAPLDTIKQAVAEVMNENLEGMMAGFEAVVQAINNKDTTAVISYRAVGEANRKYNREMETIRGY